MKNHYGFNLHYTYTTLPEPFFHKLKPDTFETLEIVYFNDALAKNLGLETTKLKTLKGTMFLAGQSVDASMHPYAMAYAGHQYGQFTNLGDGRAVMLGEHLIDNTLIDLHLKGAGPSKYARGFDGKATLRSMLLEYVYSEALHALNIPTSRSLAVLNTDEKVIRMGEQQRAVLLRTMRSHLRVGTLEFARRLTDQSATQALLDYAIKRLDPELIHNPNKVINWYGKIIKRLAKLVAVWQSVGFVHGVINTDNTALSGETIDYGPCAFIDAYDLNAVYSSIDQYGRYAFGRQPTMVSWNLAKLGEVLLPFISQDQSIAIKRVQAILETFRAHFTEHFYALMTQKIGLKTTNRDTISLVDDLLAIMKEHALDYTHTFYRLTYEPNGLKDDTNALHNWLSRWQKHITNAPETFKRMRQANPLLIPRNHRIKEALDQAVNNHDYTLLNAQLHALQNPFNKAKVPAYFITPPKEKKPFVTYCGT